MSKQPDKNPAGILADVGRALFELEHEEPPKWPGRLARALGVKGETLRSWRRGHDARFGTDHPALDRLLELVSQRRAEIARAEEELREWLRRNRTA